MRGDDGRSAAPVTQEEAFQADRLKRAVDGFTSFTSVLHQTYQSLGHRSPWPLELRIPDEMGSASLFDHTSKIDLDLALSLKSNSGPWHRVRICYRPVLESAAFAASLSG